MKTLKDDSPAKTQTVQRQESHESEIKKMLNRSETFIKNTRKNQKRDKMKPVALAITKSKDMLRWDSLVQQKRKETGMSSNTILTTKGNPMAGSDS